MKRLLLVLLITISQTHFASSQNLFLNPDFEQFSSCPTMNSELAKATNWLDCVYSCDYVNCVYTGWTVQTVIGPQSGLGYAGFATYGDAGGSAESFMQQLVAPLITGVTYSINFYAKRSPTGSYSSICTGVCFWGFMGNPVAGGPLTGACVGNIAGANLLACSDTILDDLWHQYSVSFTSTGNFDYVVISPGCAVNCGQYIFIDNITFNSSVLFADTCLGANTSFYLPDTSLLVSASWDFGDPASGVNDTSTLYNPTHVFTSTGTFLVTIIRTYTNSFVDTTHIPVTIVPCGLPQAAFQSDSAICAGSCITFTNLSTSSNAYQWSFPGGSPSSDTTANPPTICYEVSGQYSVELIASNGITGDTLTVTNYITVYPSPAAPTISQAGDSLIAPQTYSAYQWYFGSDTIVGATNYSYLATQNGNYNLIVTDSNGCSVGAGILNVIVTSIASALSKAEGVSVFPNPTTGKFEVKYYSEKNSRVTFEIINSIGQVIFKEEKQVKTGTNSFTFGNGWAEDVYLLKISSGEKIITEKIVIQK